MKTLATTIVLSLVTLTLASSAQAEFIRLSLGGSESAVTDNGYDYLSEDNFLSVGQLGVDVEVLPGLWAGLEYNGATIEDTPFPGLQTSLDIDGLLAHARYEYSVASFLSAHVQAGGGFYHLALGATIGAEDRQDTRYVGTALALAGIEFHVPRGIIRRFFGTSRRDKKGDLTFGFTLEGGYRLVTTADFDSLSRAEPDKEPEDRPIDTTDINFGRLDLSGVVLRSALVVRF